MSSHLRYDQCCSEPGCTSPAVYGEMCPRCFLAATPARRAVEIQQRLDLQLDLGAPAGYPNYPLIPDTFPPEWIK